MDLLKSLLELLIDIVTKSSTKSVQLEIPIGKTEDSPEVVQIPTASSIDWTDPGVHVSKHFTVREMLYLPTWKRLANESDGLNDEIKANLVELGKKMDTVREYFDKGINVHVTYRPLEYNKAIGGALHSAHSDGQAMDFDVMGMTCDQVREELVSKGLLDQWALRCEKTPGSNWVHLDYRQLAPGGNRYFLP